MSVAALYTQVPVIDTANTPPTLEEEINPWIFRLPGSHLQRHREVLDYIFDSLGHTRVASIRTPGRSAKTHLDFWAAYARKRGYPLVAEVEYVGDVEGDDAAAAQFNQQLDALRDSSAEVILTWCDASTSAALVKLLRAGGMDQLFVGSGSLVGSRFVEQAGHHAGRVIAAYPCGAPRSDVPVTQFIDSYKARNPGLRSQTPSREAFASFSAAKHLLEAINIAGRDRRAIQRTLADLRDTVLASLKDGSWELLTRQELKP